MSKNIHLQLTIPRGLEKKYWTFLNDEQFTEMAWIGGFGTAKTDALVTSILKTAYDYPGCRMVFARDELVNLKRTSLVDLLDKAPQLIEHHNRTESVITFPSVPDHNGVPRQSTLVCFGLMTGDYVQKLKSLQPFRIFIDEADKILEEMLDMCVLRLRQKVYHRETGALGRPQVKSVANDEGNNWYWRRYVGKPHPGKAMTPEWTRDNIGIREELFQPERAIQDLYPNDIVLWRGEKLLVEKVVEDGAYVHGYEKRIPTSQLKVIIQRHCTYAFSHENKSLNVHNLKSARGVSAAMREKYILSKVDTQTGLMFTEYHPGTHDIPSTEVPYEWRVIVGLDPGFDHPTAAVMLTLDADGDVIIFDEYEAQGLSASDNAESIAEKLEGYQDVVFYADSSLWTADPRRPGETMANDYERAGLRPLRRANKSRELSINRVKEYLKIRPSSIYRPEPKPRLFVMDHCRLTKQTLLNMTWESFRRKQHDDNLDALRYGIMAIYNAARDMPVRDIAEQAKPFVFRQY